TDARPSPYALRSRSLRSHAHPQSRERCPRNRRPPRLQGHHSPAVEVVRWSVKLHKRNLPWRTNARYSGVFSEIRKEDTKMTINQCDIGLIGLGVMGENLFLTRESKEFSFREFIRTPKVTEKFAAGR